MKVSKLVAAGLGTLAGVVAVFLYPTSTNRPAPGQADGNGSSASSGAVAGSGSGSGTGSGSGSSGSASSSSGSASSGSSSGSGASSSGSSSGSGSSGTSGSSAKSGTYTGDVVQTRWGPVQVEITVSGGTITAARAVQYPHGNGRDEQINGYALPILEQEVVSAQSDKIDAVSGATVTSDGYISSLQSAIDQAFHA
ncbi:FMN-binding protein [Cellulomonas alba]|uniref:FMN-binding protein n=1 Tax=Cellulomonas alba TaxID=3053467 RepID=A0ABT7SBL4_9CELL|nr:FMN-binding protein [Cellulomonas alba]MDM7853531.1 FMN-binding protein [Cellulomonas alba]